jgi:ATP-binding cassette subfamily C protein
MSMPRTRDHDPTSVRPAASDRVAGTEPTAGTDRAASGPHASSTALAWRLLRAVVRYSRREVAIVVALTLASGAASGAGLVMLVPLLGLTGLDVGEGSVGQISAAVGAAFEALGVRPTVPVVLLLYVAVVGVQALLQRTTSVRSVLLYQGFVRSLRRRIYAAIVHARWTFFARQRSADATHALTQEVERVGGVASALVGFVSRVIQTTILLALAVFVSPWATVVAVASGLALSLLMARATAAGRAKGEEVSQAYQSLFATIGEHLAGMRVSKSHATEAAHLERFAERTERTAGSMAAVARHQATTSVYLQVGSAVILGAVFWFALEVLALPLAGILLLLYVFARLVPQVTGLQRQVVGIVQQLPAFERIEDLIARYEASAEVAGGPAPLPLRRALRVEGVSFRYDDAPATPPLAGVSLTLRAGTTTAIVGPSGAGKSTLADVLVGLVPPTEGRVVVDDVPLEGPNVASWRRSIGYVHQDTFLFHDTIRENLRLVRQDADDAAIRAALSAAAADFVHALPLGLDTVVGDRGVRLSGGERQRIALARALLRQPALLVLDEATSSLDAESEAAIQEALDRMSGQRTVVVIAHRLATVRHADAIYVLEAGRVVQSGTWDALIAQRGGRFRALCEAQGLVGAG